MKISDRLKKIYSSIKGWIFSEKFSLAMVMISLLGLILSLVVFIVCGNWSFSSVLDEEKVAQYGDFVGGVIGTLLAFSASLLYYIALKEQQKDVKTNQKSLEKQIEEFGKQVEELELSRSVYEQQHKTMIHQQFENNFFSYFDIYLNVKEKLNNSAKSGDYFTEFVSTISSTIKYSDLQTMDTLGAYKHVIQKYSDLFIQKREAFSHYFRTLYRLVQIVNSTPIFDKDASQRMNYIKIIRSQLTESEILLIYYNIHSNYSGKARQLFYEYNILKHLPQLSKLEIKKKYQLSQNAYLKLSALFEYITPQVIKYMNTICGNPEDIPDPYVIEIEFEPLKCVFKIEYTDKVYLSMSCSDMRVVPNNLGDIMSDFFIHLFYLSQFNEPKLFSFSKKKDPVTGRTIMEYGMPIEDITKLITDK